MIRSKLLLLILVVACANTYASSKINIYTSATEKVFILDKNIVRLGKGALAWFIAESDQNFTVAYKRYISCDGNTGSEIFNSLVSTLKNKEDRLTDIENQILVGDDLKSTTYAHLQNRTETDKRGKEILKVASTIACKHAAPENEGNLLPFSQTNFDRNNTATISAIMSGTFLKKSGLIEGWIKGYRVKKDPLRDNEGRIIDAQKFESFIIPVVKNDGFDLTQVSVRCDEKKLSIMKIIQYDEFDAIKVNKSFRPEYDTPIPGSILTNWVSVICRIYS